MYVPQQFSWDARDEVASFVAEHNFGVLITRTADGARANHIPFLPRLESGYLDGHLARGNPDAGRPGEREPALAVFTGPHAYVSPRWYARPGQVPTWNYLAVHVDGELEWLHPRHTPALLDELTAFHEAAFDAPWTSDEIPAERLEKLLTAVAPFRLHIRDIQAKAKLSQNRSRADRETVANALGDDPLATLMRNTLEAE